MKENKVLNYKKQSVKYFNDAEKLLKKKDLSQASEKLWGATTSILKAVAENEGLSHNGHAQLFKIVNFLVKKTNDPEIRRLFLITNSLHINFYENWLTIADVKQGKEDVGLLIQKLEKILKSR